MSEQPPPFQLPHQTPIRRTNRTLWIIAACILIPCCGLLTAGGLYVFRLYNEFMPTAGCVTALGTMGVALEDYVKEHDGKLPKAETWQDDLRPYYAKSVGLSKMQDFIKIQPGGEWGCWEEGGKLMTGFAFNKGLSQKIAKDIKDPLDNPAIFEVPEIKRNNAQPYRLRNMKDSPKIIMGERRGWFEVDISGTVHTLIQDKAGKYRRVRLDSSQSGFDIQDESGIEVKDPSANEPKK